MADGIIGPIIVGAGGGGVILSGDPVEEAGEASRRSEYIHVFHMSEETSICKRRSLHR